MQSLPSNQQSLAGGIFSMLQRLGGTIALGISTAAYSSVAKAQAPGSDVDLPYQRAFNVSIGLAGLGCLLLPFIKLGTQGNTTDKEVGQPIVPAMPVAPAVEKEAGMEYHLSAGKETLVEGDDTGKGVDEGKLG